MSFQPTETQSAYVSPQVFIPNDWKDAQLMLTDYLQKVADAVNVREIAQYQDATLSSGVNISETATGQAYFTPGDPNKFRYGSRTVVNFGALPNTGTTSVAHGITITANTRFTRIYGVANDPSTSFIPLPFIDTAGNSVELNVDATNVNIITPSDYTAYTVTYVVLEYVEDLS